MGQKILYFYPNDASFVRKDLAILESVYEVKCFKFETNPKWITPWLWFKQFFFLLFNLGSVDIVIIQFAGYHSFLPCLISKLFGKPSLIILGGTECASFPSINYGAYRKKPLGLFTKMSLKNADYLSPVHEKMVFYEYTYDNQDYQYQGYEQFVGRVKAKIKTIYNGFENDKFYNKNQPRIKNSFITVSSKLYGTNFKLKGIDLIFNVAEHFPDATFTIVGDADGLKEPIPNNVKIVNYVPNSELINFLNQHEFYLQLSISEGFPNALGEAMMCGCIPIGSDVTSIPYIIGNTGFILRKRNVDMMQSLLQEAIYSNKKSLSLQAEQRILQHFPIEKRKQELLSLLKEMIHKDN